MLRVERSLYALILPHTKKTIYPFCFAHAKSTFQLSLAKLNSMNKYRFCANISLIFAKYYPFSLPSVIRHTLKVNIRYSLAACFSFIAISTEPDSTGAGRPRPRPGTEAAPMFCRCVGLRASGHESPNSARPCGGVYCSQQTKHGEAIGNNHAFSGIS